MFRVYVFVSSYDQRVVASIQEVEPVEWQGKTMYRDLATGRVDPNYGREDEPVFATREEAVAEAIAGLGRLQEQFAAMCRSKIDELQMEVAA
jgi:hypothetical protein